MKVESESGLLNGMNELATLTINHQKRGLSWLLVNPRCLFIGLFAEDKRLLRQVCSTVHHYKNMKALLAEVKVTELTSIRSATSDILLFKCILVQMLRSA